MKSCRSCNAGSDLGGPYFDSKNFSAIKLAPGISPHRFMGCKQPDGPEPKVCLPSLPEHRLPTMTIIKLNYIHRNALCNTECDY
eukprot:COSAG01_NODE_270_length_19812_cov_77.078324_4_plen_84_part_00